MAYALISKMSSLVNALGFWLVVVVFLLSCTLIYGTDDLSSFLHKNELRKAIRKDVLKDYDTVVGPVIFTIDGSHPIEVNFMFSVSNLVDVNTRDQTLIVNGWVAQKWNDPFLSWNETKYGGLLYAVFDPKEIWVPDIALFNNADRKEKLAGGRQKFLTFVSAFSLGQMVWLSPATFTSSCKQNVRTWPMDTQVCSLAFGSFSYNSKQLKVMANSNFKYEKGSVANGEWIIQEIQAKNSTTDYNGCCGNFSAVVYTMTLSRKPTYFMFYMSPPVIVLVLLSLLSFFIPTESGERIGFVTTILLAMMVFLNIIPDYLPRTSDEVPILGTFLIGSMTIIAGVLVATIFILLCHHRNGTPPLTIRKIFLLFSSKKSATDLNVKENEAMEMEDASKDTTKKSETESAVDKGLPGKVQEHMSWQDVSKKMNWFFFIVICVVSILATLLTTYTL